MIQIYYAYTTSAKEVDLGKLVGPLSEKMKYRIIAFKKDEDRILMLTGLFLLKEILRNNHLSKYQIQNLQYTPAGKPYFENAPFDFSISHSDGCVAVAFSSSCQVGIDIEKIKAVEFIDFIKIFPPEAWEDIITSTDTEVTFYNYWTLMESAVKADGRGLTLVSDDHIIIRGRQVIIDGTTWYSRHHIFDPAFSCCITANKLEDVRFYEVKFVYNGSPLSYIYNLQSRCISKGKWA